MPGFDGDHIGAIQRAELFAKVDELEASMKAVLKAGHLLIDTDIELANRIDALSERIDIANKRLRKLENKVHP